MKNQKQDLSTEVMSQEEYDKLFGRYKGTESNRSQSYPYLLILQNRQQSDKFQDSKNVVNSDYGKLYVKSNEFNVRADLIDKVSGTLIKEQRGGELWWSESEDIPQRLVAYKSKYVDPNYPSFNKDEKDELNDKYGVEPKNVIKLLIALDEPIVLSTGETYPIVCVTVKGGSYMSWEEDAKEQMKYLVSNHSMFKRLDDVAAPFWKVTFKTAYEKGNNSYYKFVFEIGMNSPMKVREVHSLFVSAEEFDLIPMRPVGEGASIPNLTSPVQQENRNTGASIDEESEGEKPTVKPVNDDDLPF